jgi:hypothetical protein
MRLRDRERRERHPVSAPNGAGTANGTKIILWSCNGPCNGQGNQQWDLRS